MKRILFVVGSLREGTFNGQLAKCAETALEGRARVTYLDWKEVPVFSQDKEVPLPISVQEARDAVAAADAIWFFSPVYNYAIPGSVKNLIDWLSRSLDLSNPKGESILQDKVTTVSLLANSGHEQAASQYRDLLPFVRTTFVDQLTFSGINDSAWGDGKYLPSDEVLAQLDQQATALLTAID